MSNERKIFFVVASGGHDTDRHYVETIKSKRSEEEAAKFLSSAEIEKLKETYHGRPFAIWGAVPGERNSPNWETMKPGDYVLIYRDGKYILAAEVGMKVRNPDFARHLWREDENGKTWELIYFLINETEINVNTSDMNKYLGYGGKYFPRGFMGVDQEKANHLLSVYGDLLSLINRIQQGERPKEIDTTQLQKVQDVIDKEIERAPTIHDEMQWRLISLGNKSRFDVWVPSGDQGRQFEGHHFRDFVLHEFHDVMDVPSYIKNIDSVWRLGLSVKAAFEIEHSTSIYSGILRLSDLRALAPNSNYPLFIVADEDRKFNVFQQLQRPTFTNPYLKLNEAVKFLSYNSVRELDKTTSPNRPGFEVQWLAEKAEAAVPKFSA